LFRNSVINCRAL